MSLQLIWNDEKQHIEWVDLSYYLGKTDILDPKDGRPYSLEQSEDICESVNQKEQSKD